MSDTSITPEEIGTDGEPTEDEENLDAPGEHSQDSGDESSTDEDPEEDTGGA
jgi:hypothetical protein